MLCQCFGQAEDTLLNQWGTDICATPSSFSQAEVTQRLNNAKEAANRPVVQSHDDLAKKLQVSLLAPSFLLALSCTVLLKLASGSKSLSIGHKSSPAVSIDKNEFPRVDGHDGWNG
jgi:hypothetical protein